MYFSSTKILTQFEYSISNVFRHSVEKPDHFHKGGQTETRTDFMVATVPQCGTITRQFYSHASDSSYFKKSKCVSVV